MASSPLQFRRIARLVNPDLLIILATPLLLLLANRSWIFSPPEMIDSWLYTGYFIRFEQYLNSFDGVYYAARLAWILPGYFAYTFFPPIVANLLLHLAFYYIAVIAIYLIIKYIINARVALFVATLMGCYAYFLLSIGWDYIDGAGNSYYLLTILMLTCAAKFRHWQFWLALGGFFYGASFVTNIIFLLFSPSLLLYYLLINHSSRRNNIIAGFFYFTVGLFFILVLLGGINYKFTQKFWFLLPSFSTAQSLASRPNPWQVNIYTWLPQAHWLLLPAIALVGSIFGVLISLWHRYKGNRAIHAANLDALNLCCILTSLIMLIIQARVAPVLQFIYYSSYLIPSTFLAIAAQSAFVFSDIRRTHLFVLISSILIVSLPFHTSALTNLSQYILLFLFLVVSVSLTSLSLRQRGHKLMVVMVGGVIQLGVILGVYGFVNINDSWFLWLASSSKLSSELQAMPLEAVGTAIGQPHSREAIFRATVKTQYFLKKIDPMVALAFWYNLNELPVYHTIASANLWGYRLIGQNFPDLRSPMDALNMPVKREDLKVRFQAFPKVAILSNQEDAFQQAQTSLAAIGFTAEKLAQFNINEASISFTMTVVKVSEMKSNIESSTTGG